MIRQSAQAASQSVAGSSVAKRYVRRARWLVRIPQVPGCHSYGRTIDQARARVREALGLFVDDADRVELVDDIHLAADVKKLVRDAANLRQKISEQQRTMVAAQVNAVKTLRHKMKLGHRDAGSLLGLSHQRIHQLEKTRKGRRPIALAIAGTTVTVNGETQPNATVKQYGQLLAGELALRRHQARTAIERFKAAQQPAIRDRVEMVSAAPI